MNTPKLGACATADTVDAPPNNERPGGNRGARTGDAKVSVTTSQVAVQALLITPRNCEAVTGLRWPFVRENYGHLLVKVGSKRALRASDLLRELAAANDAGASSVAESAHIDPAAHVMALLGVRRRS